MSARGVFLWVVFKIVFEHIVNCHFCHFNSRHLCGGCIYTYIYLWFVSDVWLSCAYQMKHTSRREGKGCVLPIRISAKQMPFLMPDVTHTPSLSFRLDSVVRLSPRSLYSAVWKGSFWSRSLNLSSAKLMYLLVIHKYFLIKRYFINFY